MAIQSLALVTNILAFPTARLARIPRSKAILNEPADVVPFRAPSSRMSEADKLAERAKARIFAESGRHLPDDLLQMIASRAIAAPR